MTDSKLTVVVYIDTSRDEWRSYDDKRMAVMDLVRKGHFSAVAGHVETEPSEPPTQQ